MEPEMGSAEWAVSRAYRALAPRGCAEEEVLVVVAQEILLAYRDGRRPEEEHERIRSAVGNLLRAAEGSRG